MLSIKTKIIIITGACGAGKTEVSRDFISYIPFKSALIDTDSLVAIHPWLIDESFYKLVSTNIKECVKNYLKWGAKCIIISGVIFPNGGIYDYIRFIIDSPDFEVTIYGLSATKENLKNRILKDSKIQDKDERLKWQFLNDELSRIPQCKIIDTNNLTIKGVSKIIAISENFLTETKTIILEKDIPIKQVKKVCIKIFEKYNILPKIAEDLSEELIINELEGYKSHGLFRIFDYIEEINRGIINVNSKPSSTLISNISCMIDGRRSLGFVTAKKLQKELLKLLNKEKIVVAGLKNSNHIGRLLHVAKPIVHKGYVLLGFLNYLGAGQKVAPYGGKEGRLCTNPIIFCAPGKTKPIIVDMSTSVVSEGKIREHYLKGIELPEGWLIDKDWNCVTLPSKLYESPANTFIKPLGGKLSYKGFNLSLFTEILSGIITGAGFSSPTPQVGGNGGLFIAFHPNILGVKTNDIYNHIEILFNYIKNCPVADGYSKIKIPGQNSLDSSSLSKAKSLLLNEDIWLRLNNLT